MEISHNFKNSYFNDPTQVDLKYDKCFIYKINQYN